MLASIRSSAFSASRQASLASRRALSSSAVARQHFLNASPEQFEAQAIKGGKVTVVDFYADWCGPCRFLSPVLERVISEESGADLMTIDTDAHVELAQKYKITSLPTVLAFKSGEIVGKFIGAQPEAGVKNFLQKVTA
ncbi:hypothetical protein JCM8097_004634 [Rhodosporidiobolus ruineniae]